MGQPEETWRFPIAFLLHSPYTYTVISRSRYCNVGAIAKMLGEETGMAPGAENILDLRATLIVSSAKQAVI
jgi:hypothetical protein